MTLVKRRPHAQRRALVRAHPTLNGLDFVEIDDDSLTLTVTFLNDNGVAALAASDFTIQADPDRPVVTIDALTPVADDTVALHLDRLGDAAPYKLRLLPGLAGFDATLAQQSFRFRLDCLEDCGPAATAAAPPLPPARGPHGKDYATLRQLLLDQMASQMPAWRDASPADPAVTLVELLAHVGDALGQRQDAVSREGYLDTATERVSLRRLTRLVDYRVDEGRSARAWVQVQVELDGIEIPAGAMILSRPGTAAGNTLPPASAELQMALSQAAFVFETLHSLRPISAHNEMPLYGWGEVGAQLEPGATSATLVGHYPTLQAGDLLILQEAISPTSGSPLDADPARRHAVRVTHVELDNDPVGGTLLGKDEANLPITHIDWDGLDALPLALTLTAETEAGQLLTAVSSALGNIVAADHGQTIAAEPLGAMPAANPALVRWRTDGNAVPTPPRWQPTLAEGPLARLAPYDPTAPANQPLADPADCPPSVSLTDGQRGTDWSHQPDLLASGPTATDFVVETNTSSAAALRFGDNVYGQRPVSGTSFYATYRVGVGAHGNVGPDSLTHLVTDEMGVTRVSNPMAAFGGHDPETNDTIRERAPHAFRRQRRAVTPADYARRAAAHPAVQRAAAARRWTGSWYTIFLAVDRVGGQPLDAPFQRELRAWLASRRLAGHEVALREPQFVPLDITLTVCPAAGVQRSRLDRALRRALGSATSGFFHPDRWQFGQTLYLSQLLARGRGVAGVAALRISRCRRLGSHTPVPPDERLPCGPLEIFRLNDDRNRPENGMLTIAWEGDDDAT